MFVPDTEFLTVKGPIRGASLSGGESLHAFSGPGRSAALPIRRLSYRTHNAQVIRIATEHGFCLTVTPDHRLFVQMKPSQHFYDVFLVKREGLGYVVGLGNGQFRDISESTTLYERQKDKGSTVVEKSWIIASFRSLTQATYVEQLLAVRYGLPVLALDPRLRRHGVPEDVVDRLLLEVDTLARAPRLLKDADLFEDRPHFQRKLLSPHDQARTHYLDGVLYEPTDPRKRGPSFRHVLRVFSLGDGVRFDRDRIRYVGPGEPQTEVFEQTEQLDERLAAHAKDAHTDTERRIALPLGRPFFVWPATYIREGMVLPIFTGTRYQEAAVNQVSRVEHTGDVLEVLLEGTPGVVAGGILVGTQ